MAAEGKLLLGRPGNHLKMGIVGMPNVGKSTLFNCLSKLNVPASNFPFCTIDPNVARVEVPDARWDWLCDHWKPVSRVPAYLTITDIAGLVKGASAGLGLGNAFLSHIAAVDGIFHVTRVFEDEGIAHVEGGVDPVRDLEIICDELRAKDLQALETALEANAKNMRSKQKGAKEEGEMLEKFKLSLQEGKHIRYQEWNNKEIDFLNSLTLLTAKPVILLINMSEEDFIRKKNKWLPKIKTWIDAHAPGTPMIPFSGQVESTLLALDEAGQTAWLTENKCQSSLSKIIVQGYNILDMIHYFTCGEDEVKSWTVRRATKAPQAAGVIHTDFEKGFICADVMAYTDFKEAGSEAACKASGKYRQEGKGYVVDDGDIIFFKFNAAAGGKKK
jgi:obg-like ATPase 1